MSHKDGKGFFRRIRSPLEHKTTKDKAEDKHRSSSTGLPPTPQSNGHRRNGSDDVLRIENTAYGDPEILNSSSRSNSTGTSPGDLINPPLPPRNPPKQPSKMDSESAVYVTPADTIQRGNNAISQAVLSNYTRADPISGPPSRTERRAMEMHKLTMSQKQKQDQGQATQRVQSVSVIDNSEYSTPFNLLQQQQQGKMKGGKSGSVSSSGSTRQRHVAQTGTSDENDKVIPVLSPPPQQQGGFSDRSQTTSPSSPLSTPSSEHDEGGSGAGSGGTDNDYDIPWDKKFKEFPNFNRAPRRQPSGGKLNHPQDDGKEQPPPHSGSKVIRDNPPQRSMYPRGYVDRSSPPAPPERNPPGGGGGPIVYQNRGRRSSPPLPEDRPRYLPARHQSEQQRPRDGSSSPNPMAGRPYSNTVHGPHIPRDLPPEISPRTSSMSIPPHMSGRRLPSPPRERSESSPVEPGRRGMLRPPSPPNPVHIDFSIPLCDQPWYHGDIKRRYAEQILIDQPDFSFLVRDSESCRTDYSLSIRDSANGFIHLRMVQETDSNSQLGYVLGQFSSHFPTVAECIAFYTKQRLNIRGAEHKKLRYPVPRASDTMASFRV